MPFFPDRPPGPPDPFSFGYPVTVSLYTSAPGSLGGPDALVAVLTNRSVFRPGADPFDPAIFSYAAAGPVLLAADAEYWVVAEMPPIPGTFFFQNIWFDAPAFSPYRGAFRSAPGGEWFVSDNQEDFFGLFVPVAVRVEATPTPEPASLAVFGGLLLAGGWAARRRARSQAR